MFSRKIVLPRKTRGFEKVLSGKNMVLARKRTGFNRQMVVLQRDHVALPIGNCFRQFSLGNCGCFFPLENRLAL